MIPLFGVTVDHDAPELVALDPGVCRVPHFRPHDHAPCLPAGEDGDPHDARRAAWHRMHRVAVGRAVSLGAPIG